MREVIFFQQQLEYETIAVVVLGVIAIGMIILMNDSLAMVRERIAHEKLARRIQKRIDAGFTVYVDGKRYKAEAKGLDAMSYTTMFFNDEDRVVFLTK